MNGSQPVLRTGRSSSVAKPGAHAIAGAHSFHTTNPIAEQHNGASTRGPPYSKAAAAANVAAPDDLGRALGQYWSAVSRFMIPYRLSAALIAGVRARRGGCENERNAPRRPRRRPPRRRPRRPPRPGADIHGQRHRLRDGAHRLDAGRRSRGPAVGRRGHRLDLRDGTFTIPNVANGTYTLRVAKAGYETQTRSVTVSGANVGGIVVNLLPVFRWVDREFTAELEEGDAPCTGTSKPCRSYAFASHHSGDVRAFAAWTNTAPRPTSTSSTWCNGQPGGGARHARQRPRRDPAARSAPDRSCEMHIILFSGGPMRYTLYLRIRTSGLSVDGWCGSRRWSR